MSAIGVSSKCGVVCRVALSYRNGADSGMSTAAYASYRSTVLVSCRAVLSCAVLCCVPYLCIIQWCRPLVPLWLICWDGRRLRRVDHPIVTAPSVQSVHCLTPISSGTFTTVCTSSIFSTSSAFITFITFSDLSHTTLLYAVNFPRCFTFVYGFLAWPACLQWTAGPWAQLHRERADTAESPVLHQVQDSADGVRTGPHRNSYQ